MRAVTRRESPPTLCLGAGAVYAKVQTGGRVAYAWFGLLNTSQAEPILYDLFTYLANRLNPRNR